MTALRVEINGVVQEGEVDARLLLVDFIREELGLTGTHSGCGACTVIVDGQPVKSCLMLAVQADGGNVTTIEGIGSEDAPHPVQEAFIAEGAVQCGYCTPGFVVSAVALLDRIPSPSDEEVRKGLLGNVCRCGCYQGIRAAVQRAGDGGSRA
jgi:aerobic carbon-monoxide dehydrogenase small subunit